MSEAESMQVDVAEDDVEVDSKEAGAIHNLQDAGRAAAEVAGAVASDRLKTEVNARSSRLAVELKAFAVSMRMSSQSLREQGHDSQADIVDDVASRADRLASRLATSDSDDLVEDAKRLLREAAAFARQEPLLVIAGALTLGLLAPRLFRAATASSSEDSEREE